jgi:hypothetical protein
MCCIAAISLHRGNFAASRQFRCIAAISLHRGKAKN